MTQLKINDFYNNSSDTLTPITFSRHDRDKDEDGTTQTNISFHSFKIQKSNDLYKQKGQIEAGMEEESTTMFEEEDYKRNMSTNSLNIFSNLSFEKSENKTNLEDDSFLLKKRKPNELTEPKYENVFKNSNKSQIFRSENRNRTNIGSKFSNSAKFGNKDQKKLDWYFGSSIEVQEVEKVIYSSI